MYVLRTWEAEFPDLGVSKTANSPRVYRRADVERVLRIKHLLFAEGLTMAGVRRRLAEEAGALEAPPDADLDLSAVVDLETRQRLREVRQGLQWILGVLSNGATGGRSDFVLQAETANAAAAAGAVSGAKPPTRAKRVAPRKR